MTQLCRGSLPGVLSGAAVLIALSHVVAPAIAGASRSDVAEQDTRQEVHAEAQGTCSSVLPSGKIAYFPCGKEPAHVCSAVTAEGEIVYFICGGVKEGRKTD
jgi:hypothetical protein